MNRYNRRLFDAEQKKQPAKLTRVTEWPSGFQNIYNGSQQPLEVWRSQKFLVVVYGDMGYERVTVNRCELEPNGDWKAGITWDELQKIKRDIGRGDKWAVECYPPDSEVVNVANLRHLWLLDAKPGYGWHKQITKEKT